MELTIKAPSYAPDGSRGYFLALGNREGWIYTGTDGTVYATLDHGPWTVVGAVAEQVEFTPEWIQDRKTVIGSV